MAGSAMTILFSRCCRRVISSKETSCAASLMPMNSPVSCVGKKPFGITMKSPTLVATVAMKTISVTKRNRRATSSVRS